MSCGISKKNFKVLISSILVAIIFALTKCHIGISGLKSLVNYLSITISFFVYFEYLKRKKYSRFVIAFVLYLIVLLFSTLLNNSDFVSLVFKNYYLIAAIIMFFDMVDFKKETSKYIIKGWYFAFSLITIVNFFTIVLYPDGLYKSSIYTNNWFLGYDNMHICFYYSTILFLIIDKCLSKRSLKLFDYIIFLIISFQVFYCFSANSVVSYSIMLFLFILEAKRNFLSYFDIKKLYIVNLVFNFLFVILRIQKKFEWLIVGLLGKKLDFSGRVVIWDKIIDLISKKKLLGYGQEPVSIISSKLGNPAFAHAHNTILDITYKSGLIGLIMHFCMHLFSIEALYKSRNYKVSRYVAIVLFAFIILTMMEARQENFNMYIILVFSFNIKKIINGGIYE